MKRATYCMAAVVSVLLLGPEDVLARGGRGGGGATRGGGARPSVSRSPSVNRSPSMSRGPSVSRPSVSPPSARPSVASRPATRPSTPSRPVEGMVDQQTQRAAWSLVDGKNADVVMETGLYHLTEDEATALVHFGNERTQTWLMVRLDELEGEAAGEQ